MGASKPLPLPSEVRVGISQRVPASTGRATAGHTGIIPLLFNQGSETQCPSRFRGLTLHKPNRPAGIQYVPPHLGRRERETTSEGLQNFSHHQRSCQGTDPGQGSESQRQSACEALRLSANCSLEKAECLLHLVNESRRWQGPVQTATVGHLKADFQ